MAESSRPWTGSTTGDAGPYSALQWQDIFAHQSGFFGDDANASVLLGSEGAVATPPLQVQQNSPTGQSVLVTPGSASVQGLYYRNSTNKVLTLAANASGNPRIDLVVLRVDYTAQTVRLVVKQGTAAGSPTRPALTQTGGVTWEVPLAEIAVASGFTNITTSNITNYPQPSNLHSTIGPHYILNNSGGDLKMGDVVVLDTSATRAVTTSAGLLPYDVAGVWDGLTPNGARGRMVTHGLAYVNVDGAVNRGDLLGLSATAKKATVTYFGAFARALESIGAAGLVLCFVDVSMVRMRTLWGQQREKVQLRDVKAQGTDGGTFTSGADRRRDLNTKVYDPHSLVILGTHQFSCNRLGQWWIRARVPAYAVENHQAKLRNITAGTDVVIGSPAFCDFATSSTSPAMTDSWIIGPFTVTNTAHLYEIWHRCASSKSNDGFGNSANWQAEVYTEVELEYLGV